MICCLAVHIVRWCKQKHMRYNEGVRANVNAAIRDYCIELRTKSRSAEPRKQKEKQKSTTSANEKEDLSKIADSEEDME